MICDANMPDKAFMTRFVQTQMFNQFIEDNFEVQFDSEGDDVNNLLNLSNIM